MSMYMKCLSMIIYITDFTINIKQLKYCYLYTSISYAYYPLLGVIVLSCHLGMLYKVEIGQCSHSGTLYHI